MIEKIKSNKEYYQCEECKLIYKEKKWAEKCENWCRNNKSCNIEVTKHSIKTEKEVMKTFI